MRKLTTKEVAQKLGLSEATVRKRNDLPVVEILGDGQHLYDGDRIDLLRLAKAMRLGNSLADVTQTQIIEKFLDCVENRAAAGDQDGLNALLEVSPLVLKGASDTDRRRLGLSVMKAIVQGGPPDVQKLVGAGNVRT